MYSMTTDAAIILECLDLGAVCYLTKAEGRDHLVAAVLAPPTRPGTSGPAWPERWRKQPPPPPSTFPP